MTTMTIAKYLRDRYADKNKGAFSIQKEERASHRNDHKINFRNLGGIRVNLCQFMVHMLWARGKMLWPQGKLSRGQTNKIKT